MDIHYHKMRFFVYSTAILLILVIPALNGDIGYAQDEETDLLPPIVTPGFVAQNSHSTYQAGMVVNPGFYYTIENNSFIPHPLPEPGSEVQVLSHFYTYQDKSYSYYWAEGEGWAGWASEKCIAAASLHGEVNTEALNVRSEPHSDATVMRKLKIGDTVSIGDRSTQPETIDGVTGYWVLIYGQDSTEETPQEWQG